MTYLDFRKEFFDHACFHIHQIYAWQPEFDRKNLTRWKNKGYIFRLKQGYYAFSEYLTKHVMPFILPIKYIHLPI